MFENLEKDLVPLFKEKKLEYVGSYVPNGELYYIEKDTKNERMIVEFSLLPESEFNRLLANLEDCINSYNFDYSKKVFRSGIYNAVILDIHK